MGSRRKRTQRDRRALIPDFDEPLPRQIGAFLMEQADDRRKDRGTHAWHQ